MRILFLTHYYPPESNAPANRVSELAREWVGAGHEVTVVTCTPSHPGGRPYPGYRNPFFHAEQLDGVQVIRLGTYLAANQGTVRRSLNYVSFMLSAILQAGRLPAADVVISTSPQFFAGIAGAFVARKLRAPWIFEVRDIWPESVSAVAAGGRGPAFRLLEKIEAWAYGAADQIVAVSPAFIEHLAARAPLKRPVRIVENGVDLALFGENSEARGFRERHGLRGKTVFGYVGTHGMAHSLQTVLEAAALTRDDPTIAYLLVGSGAERQRLVARRAELGLENVVMLDHQPRAEMPAIWSSVDVSLVVLRRSPLFHRVIPSKMFEAMAMARPIIMAVDGQARRILESSGGGLFVEPEDPQALAQAVRRLARDPAQRAAMGAEGKAFVRANYDRSVLAKRYLEIIQALPGLAPEPHRLAAE
ncbi:glycosyltransferase family 4 protein [Phenylobacterium sp.]|uniref:glycosyltransferase family 4 protein n=1 Tax=Phenylobacterium sp. TaxID=1871053 RepID=UPI002810A18B|nr:glycosyltransferase family 4 protein [Phenylobacterium sp.]